MRIAGSRSEEKKRVAPSVRTDFWLPTTWSYDVGWKKILGLPWDATKRSANTEINDLFSLNWCRSCFPSIV